MASQMERSVWKYRGGIALAVLSMLGVAGLAAYLTYTHQWTGPKTKAATMVVGMAIIVIPMAFLSYLGIMRRNRENISLARRWKRLTGYSVKYFPDSYHEKRMLMRAPARQPGQLGEPVSWAEEILQIRTKVCIKLVAEREGLHKKWLAFNVQPVNDCSPLDFPAKREEEQKRRRECDELTRNRNDAFQKVEREFQTFNELWDLFKELGILPMCPCKRTPEDSDKPWENPKAFLDYIKRLSEPPSSISGAGGAIGAITE